MVDFPIETGIRKIGNSILTPLVLDPQEPWFNDGTGPPGVGIPTTILLSNTNVLGTIVVDFAFDTPTVVEYTLDGGGNFIAFNQGLPVTGGQSRFIDVTTGNLVNFRATLGGTLIRCIVSSVP